MSNDNAEKPQPMSKEEAVRFCAELLLDADVLAFIVNAITPEQIRALALECAREKRKKHMERREFILRTALETSGQFAPPTPDR